MAPSAVRCGGGGIIAIRAPWAIMSSSAAMLGQKIGHAEAQYKVESFWMGGLRKAAVDGDVARGSCMAGQSVGLVDKVQPMKEIFAELLSGAEAELESVKARMAAIGS